MSLRIASYCRFLVNRNVLQSANSVSFNQSAQLWGKKKKNKGDTDRDQISDEMKEAVKNVSKSVPGYEQKTERDLLGSLFRKSEALTQTEEGKASTNEDQNIGDLLKNMKSKNELFKDTEDKFDTTEKFRLFEGPDLGIFNHNAKEKVQYETTGEVYDSKQSLRYILEREKFEAMSIKSIPTNGFQEMINWTKEGKLWNFPINNEFGKEDSRVGFDEHVFLENEIKDFPRKGPIRHFIELVVVGLSRNPHISAKSKRNHINWFREYFKSKSKILEESLGDASKFTERKSSSVNEQKSLS